MKIANKLLSVISNIIERSFTISADKIKRKINDVEHYLIHVLSVIVIQYIIKTTFIISGMILGILAIIKLLNQYYPSQITYGILGISLLIIGLLIKAKPLSK